MCQACLEANGPRALWLSWVKCTDMELHWDERKITVVVSGKRLVRVHPLPESVTSFSQVKICTSQQIFMDAICFSCSSKRAHSIGELLYWRWQVAKKSIFKKVSLYTITSDTPNCRGYLVLVGMCMCNCDNRNLHSSSHREDRKHLLSYD